MGMGMGRDFASSSNVKSASYSTKRLKLFHSAHEACLHRKGFFSGDRAQGRANRTCRHRHTHLRRGAVYSHRTNSDVIQA